MKVTSLNRSLCGGSIKGQKVIVIDTSMAGTVTSEDKEKILINLDGNKKHVFIRISKDRISLLPFEPTDLL